MESKSQLGVWNDDIPGVLQYIMTFAIIYIISLDCFMLQNVMPVFSLLLKCSRDSLRRLKYSIWGGKYEYSEI